jgi:acyl-coenzyme A synthetase/AMP-(fatty) acid ligase
MNIFRDVLEAGSSHGERRTAVIFEGASWTYGDLARKSRSLAEVLHSLGIGRGDRVAIVLPNRPEYYVAFFACAYIGAVLCTVNIEFRSSEIASILSNAAPSAVLVDRRGAEVLRALGENLNLGLTPILELPDANGSVDLGRMLSLEEDPRGLPMLELDADEPVLILYTSGSTAMPKAVLSTHGAEAWSAAAHRGIWRINPLDTVALPLTLAWAYGLCTVSLTCLSAGATIALLDRFKPDELALSIARERATLFFGVTTMFVMLSRYADEIGLPDLSSLRFALSGGEVRDEDVFRWFTSVAGAPVSDAYAMSEVRPAMTYDAILEPSTVLGSCGRLVPGVEAMVVDDRGEPLPTGEVGELWLRSRGMFSGYFAQPELTAERLTQDGWFKTGDMMRESSDGHWYFAGRADDVIRRGGANVSPREVEGVLRAHPQVDEVAVVGIPDATFGHVVVAVIVGSFENDSEATESLVRYTTERLAEFKIPTRVVLVGQIPLTNTGKLDRRAIRALFGST